METLSTLTLNTIFSSWSVFLISPFFELLSVAVFVGIVFLFFRFFRGF